MDSAMPLQVADNSAGSTPDTVVIARFRKAFVRSLKPGRRLTSVEGQAVDRAVNLTFAAQKALLNPTVSHVDRVRLDNAASRARKEAKAVVDAGKREKAD